MPLDLSGLPQQYLRGAQGALLQLAPVYMPDSPASSHNVQKAQVPRTQEGIFIPGTSTVHNEEQYKKFPLSVPTCTLSRPAKGNPSTQTF